MTIMINTDTQSGKENKITINQAGLIHAIKRVKSLLDITIDLSISFSFANVRHCVVHRILMFSYGADWI